MISIKHFSNNPFFNNAREERDNQEYNPCNVDLDKLNQGARKEIYWSLYRREETKDGSLYDADFYEVVVIRDGITYYDLNELEKIHSTKLVVEILKDYKPNIMDEYIRSSTEIINKCHNADMPSLGWYLEYANDKEVVMEFVKIDGLNLQYASERLRADAEVALEAINQNIDAIEYVDHDLFLDADFICENAKIIQKHADNGKKYVR